jgi:kynurenine 3-monooxygenase
MCTDIDFENTTAHIEKDGETDIVASDIILGADGAFSALRAAIQKTDRFDYSQNYISHGYKELSFPPDTSGDFALEKNALHIWPRKDFMLIALPNLDKSFTVTLFLPFEGEKSFESLNSDEEISDFFNAEFPDALKLMPGLLAEFKQNPAASLVTVRCYPWVKDNVALIGDAAHAVVPFYGQGMIAGFEDCYVLNSLLETYNDDWNLVLEAFQNQRKPDADAIADLALHNFVVMRDKVADEKFLLRKKIEAHLNTLYPEKWIPLYSMVTFNENMRYSEALAKGKKQEKVMDEVMRSLGENDWRELDFKMIITKI